MPIIITHTENCTRVKQGHRHPITAPRGLAFCLPKSLRLPCRNLPPLFHNILTLRSNSRRHIHTTLRRPCHCSSAPHVLPPPFSPFSPFPASAYSSLRTSGQAAAVLTPAGSHRPLSSKLAQDRSIYLHPNNAVQRLQTTWSRDVLAGDRRLR